MIAYHIARERVRSKTAEEAVARAMQKIKGAYSLVIMSPRKLMGARDPQGFRPLCIGKGEMPMYWRVKPVHWIRSVPSL